MLSMTFSRQQFDFFFIFPRKEALTFQANGHMKFKAYFLGKIRKIIINLLFAEYAQRVIKLNLATDNGQLMRLMEEAEVLT